MKSNYKNVFFELFPILILFIIIFFSTIIWLYERYIAADTYYSHGFLIPFVSGFLIWQNRKELSQMQRKHSYRGIFLVIFSLIVHFLSILSEVFFISGFSILFFVFGVSLFLYGPQITKRILFPLFFLIFMFPLPLVAINAISFPMKMFATKSAVFLLKTGFNIPIKNEGFQIFFPNASLIVENPCSGLRSLITLLALGSIFAYLLKASFIKRIGLFLLSIPIALLSNLIRVVLLSLGVYIYGSNITKSFFHDSSGYLVFAISFICLLLIWRKFKCNVSG